MNLGPKRSIFVKIGSFCTPKDSFAVGGLFAGGVLGLKTDGGVPLAAENWTQKDRGKKLNLGPKRSIFVKIGSFCTPKDSFAVGG